MTNNIKTTLALIVSIILTACGGAVSADYEETYPAAEGGAAGTVTVGEAGTAGSPEVVEPSICAEGENYMPLMCRGEEGEHPDCRGRVGWFERCCTLGVGCVELPSPSEGGAGGADSVERSVCVVACLTTIRTRDATGAVAAPTSTFALTSGACDGPDVDVCEANADALVHTQCAAGEEPPEETSGCLLGPLS
jgi:hypothetical protein